MADGAFAQMLKQTQKAVTNVLFPAKCQACGRFLDHGGDAPWRVIPRRQLRDMPMDELFCRIMSPFLCSDCIMGFTPITSPYCTQCGRMFETRNGADHLCGDCIQTQKYHHAVRSAGIYDGAVMALIHAFKYNGRIQLAPPFAMLLYAAFLKDYAGSRFDLALPVPLHISKLKQRGFNQSALILREWGYLAREPDAPLPPMDLTQQVLIRKKKTASQTGLGREKRKTNIKNAFRVIDASRVLNKKMLLIDDVLTTGATVNECARVLMGSGAESVDVLTIARAH
jgi:ComF family protein